MKLDADMKLQSLLFSSVRFTTLFVLLLAITFQFLPISPLLSISIVIVVTILMWAVQLFPPWLVALLFITTCCLGKLVEPALALQGFLASGTWLVFAGLIIGMAMKRTGLAVDFANKLVPLLRGSFSRSLLGFMVFGLVCVFLIPSAMGRVVLLLPIFKELAVQLGYDERSDGYTHLLLGGVFATYFPAFAVLPANVPNNVLLGATESLFGNGPGYLHYLVVHFPVLGIAKTLLIFIVLWLPLKNIIPSVQQQKNFSIGISENTREKKQLILILTIMLLLWLTEPLHKLSTAWIGMLAAVFCFLPGIKVLPEKPFEKLNLSPMFYVAGIISLGAVASHSELIPLFNQKINEILTGYSATNSISFMLLSALSTITGLFVTLPAAPAVLTPLTTSLSTTLGISQEAVYLTQIVGLSCVWLPYQAPPLIIAKSMGNISWRKLTTYCFVISALSIFILWPVDFLWWKFIGLF